MANKQLEDSVIESLTNMAQATAGEIREINSREFKMLQIFLKMKVKISMKISDSVNEMNTGAQKINETGQNLLGMSAAVGEAIQDIGSQIETFEV